MVTVLYFREVASQVDFLDGEEKCKNGNGL